MQLSNDLEAVLKSIKLNEIIYTLVVQEKKIYTWLPPAAS